jgi:hypothetical protein
MKKTIAAFAAASMLFSTSAFAGGMVKTADIVEPEIIVPEVPVAGVAHGNLGYIAAGAGALLLAAALLRGSSTTTTTTIQE